MPLLGCDIGKRKISNLITIQFRENFMYFNINDTETVTDRA
jgi:hypothetical protein